MRPRNEGEAVTVPVEFLRQNRPTDPSEAAEWNDRRARWFRANGYSYLEVLMAEYSDRRASERGAA